VILPDSFIVLDHMLRRFTRIVKGLVVNVDRMRQNLELSRGVVFSGTVLLELAQRGIAREQAYEWVQRNALRSYDEQKDFKQLLLADKDVMGVLDQKTVEDAFSLKVQLKNVETIFDRVFGPAPAAAGGGIGKLKTEN
jgi:adenylosuccinate lyase